MITSSPRSRRLVLALAAGALLATTATACEPPPPPPVFTADPTATGPDADPGDGACATTADACSLQAAVEETNALGTPTEIVVGSTSAAPADLVLTGAVTLVPADRRMQLQEVDWTIAASAQLTVTDGRLGVLDVAGTFVGRRVVLGSGTRPTGTAPALLAVAEGGTALLANGFVHAWPAVAIANAGTTAVFATTVQVDATPDHAAIDTTAGGQTRLSATALVPPASWDTQGVACSGAAPTSYGYNLAPDASCGLTMTGDRQDFDDWQTSPHLGEDARVDAVPVGTLHCGEGWTDDFAGEGTRPADGDGDGTPACDIGFEELAAT